MELVDAQIICGSGPLLAVMNTGLPLAKWTEAKSAPIVK